MGEMAQAPLGLLDGVRLRVWLRDALRLPLELRLWVRVVVRDRDGLREREAPKEGEGVVEGDWEGRDMVREGDGVRDWVRVRVWVRLREAPREVEREGEAATDGDAEPVEVGDGEGVVDGGDPTLALLVGVRDPVGLFDPDRVAVELLELEREWEPLRERVPAVAWVEAAEGVACGGGEGDGTRYCPSNHTSLDSPKRLEAEAARVKGVFASSVRGAHRLMDAVADAPGGR